MHGLVSCMWNINLPEILLMHFMCICSIFVIAVYVKVTCLHLQYTVYKTTTHKSIVLSCVYLHVILFTTQRPSLHRVGVDNLSY